MLNKVLNLFLILLAAICLYIVVKPIIISKLEEWAEKGTKLEKVATTTPYVTPNGDLKD